jgi:hypothetical protein
VLTTHSDPLLFGQAGFAIESQDRWAASVFVDNVGNENGISNAYVVSPTALTGARSMHPRPRTFGVQLDYRY